MTVGGSTEISMFPAGDSLHHGGVRITALALLLTCIAIPTASAQPAVYVVEPEAGELYWNLDFLDDPSPIQRIRIRNDGDPVNVSEVRIPRGFELVDSGGDLQTGGEVFFDVRCAPLGQDIGDAFWLNWCGVYCEDEGFEYVWLYCNSGRVTPDAFDVTFAPVFQDEAAVASISVTNPRAEPIAIDGVSVAPPFTAAVDGGSVTLDQGEAATITAVVRPDGLPSASGELDVLAGGRVATRVRLQGIVWTQLEPSRNVGAIPVGPPVTMPMTLRNSSALTRTITAVTSDTPGVSLPDLVGTAMAPRQVLSFLATVDAAVVGAIYSSLSVSFDTGPGSSALLFATVVPADFAIEMADATPTDGWLALGAVDVDAAPIDRAVVLRNFSSEPLPIFMCASPVPGFRLVGGCPAEVPPGDSVEVLTRFTPSAAISIDDYRGVVHDRLVLGLGNQLAVIGVHAQLVEAGAPLLAVDDQIDLGEAEVGSTAAATLLVRNVGRLGVVVDRMEVTGAAFSFSEPLSYRIGSLGTLAVEVGFAPVQEGAQGGELRLYAGGAAEPVAIVALSGLGIASDPGDDDGDGHDDDDGTDDGSGDSDGDGTGDADGDGDDDSDDGTGDGDDGAGDSDDGADDADVGDGDDLADGHAADGGGTGCAVSGGGGAAGDLFAVGIALLAAGSRRRRARSRRG